MNAIVKAYTSSDTIVAISTAPGEGAISIIRLSGPQAFSITESVFKGAKNLDRIQSHSLTLGHIVHPDNGEIIDEIMLTVLRAPHTYTTEDIVEINAHGGVLVTRKILQVLLDAGARLAEQGEFTRRAYLHGRLDLTQVEGVINLIRARSDRELDAALAQLGGKTKTEIQKIKEELVSLYVQVQAAIDFSEEGIHRIDGDKCKARVTLLIDRLISLEERIEWGRVVQKGISVVIAGKPNAGKSTLLNELLETERVLVSSLPGTTRDAVEESMQIKGTLFTFVDTAGLGNVGDPFSDELEKKTQHYITQAEIILNVIDGTGELSADDLQFTENSHKIIIINKADLGLSISQEEVKHRFGTTPYCVISAKTGDGVENLKECLYRIGTSQPQGGQNDAVITSVEQLQQLQLCRESLTSLRTAICDDISEEYWSEHLKKALNFLDLFTGKISTEDVLDRIFSQFCIGK